MEYLSTQSSTVLESSLFWRDSELGGGWTDIKTDVFPGRIVVEGTRFKTIGQDSERREEVRAADGRSDPCGIDEDAIIGNRSLVDNDSGVSSFDNGELEVDVDG